MQQEGTILCSVSGFYTVESEGTQYICKARGKLRRDASVPLVGDRVLFEPDGTGGVIDGLLPRKNMLIRPPVANVDLLVLFASDVIPISDPFLIDRICSNAAIQNIPVLICVNKSDLAPSSTIAGIYEKVGIPTVCTSAESGEGTEKLLSMLHGKFCVFTGNSGVGKSSVLNRLNAELQLPTGEVSEKLGRGRHTTRHVEIYTLPDGTRVADTPGFSAFDGDYAEPMVPENLSDTFCEFVPLRGQCRYADCTHRKEPGCAVREAVEKGTILPSRYESYLRLYALAEKHKQWE